MVADALILGYLAQFDDDAWPRVVDRLEPAIRPVTLVIPPWNGQIGARIEKVRVADVE